MLGARLSAIAVRIRQGSRLVDVGTDHAYLPIFAVSEKICPSAIATDIQSGPAAVARAHVAAAGLAERCEIQVAYAIGVARPVSVLVDTFGTAKVAEEKIADALNRHFDLRPAAIIERFGLRRPIYSKLAAYGHMGREDLDAPWERRDLAEILKAELL